MIVAVVAVAMFAGSSAATSVFSVFIRPLSQEFGWSRTLISGAMSVGTLGTALVAVIAGRLVDRYGPRLLTTIAALSLGAGLIVMSLTRSLLTFYLAWGLMRTIGFGILRIACPTAVANWFIQKRGRATAIIYIGSAAGIGIMPILAQAIMNFSNWRMAAQVLAIMILGSLVVPAALWLRRRPEDVGLSPDGLPPAADPTRTPGVSPAEPQWTLRQALKTSTLWLLISATFLENLASAGVTTHLIPFLIDRGIESTAAASVVGVYALFWAVTVLGWGYLGERIDPRVLLSLTFLLSGAALGILAIAHSLYMALAYAVLYGITIGATNTFESLVWANYYGRTSLGSIRGFAIPFQQVALSLGPLIAAIAYDATGSYQGVFTLMAIGSSLGGGIVFLAKPPRKADYFRLSR